MTGPGAVGSFYAEAARKEGVTGLARLLLAEDEPAHREFYRRFPKIVIKTGHESYEPDFACCGADGFIVKSSDPRELGRKVGQGLSERAGKRQSRN